MNQRMGQSNFESSGYDPNSQIPVPVLSLTSLYQVHQQFAPVRPELVGAGEAAVATDHTQVGDAEFHQVAGGLHAALPGLEVLAAGTTDHGATLEWEMDGVNEVVLCSHN